MVLGLLTSSFAIASPIGSFEAVGFGEGEVLRSREARGLVGDGWGDGGDMVDGWLVVVRRLVCSSLEAVRMIARVTLVFESSLEGNGAWDMSEAVGAGSGGAVQGLFTFRGCEGQRQLSNPQTSNLILLSSSKRF